MKDKIKELTSSLSADTKRKVVLGSLAACILLLFYFGYVKKEEMKAIDKPKEVKTFSLVDPKMAEETWLNKASGDIEAINREVKELKKIVEILVQNPGRGNGIVPEQGAGNVFKPTAETPDSKDSTPSIFEQLNKIAPPSSQSSSDSTINMGQLAPPSAVEVRNAGVNSEVFAVPNPTRERSMESVLAENESKKDNKSASKSGSAAATHDSNQDQNVGAPLSSIAVVMPPASQEAMALAEKEKAEKDRKPDEIIYSIPTGSFMNGKLLNGIFAATGEKASANPYPILVSIQDLSFLPNDVRQDWDGCFILGEGYGQLSSERVMGRAINISCINKSNRKVMDVPVKGYFVGNDGYNGLRGEVVTKQGQFLLRTLAASFIEGVAMGFNNAASTVTVTDSGAVTSTDSVSSFGDGMKVGALSGASNAATKLAEFYMDLAEDLFPGIEVEAGREATIVLTEPLNVKFEHNLYQGGLNNETL